MQPLKFRVFSYGKYKYINTNYDLNFWSAKPMDGPEKPLSEMEWEQFTGMKDTKGCPLYAKDIVHHSSYIDGANHYIEYIPDWGCYMMIDEDGDALMLSEELQSITLIGNMNQNKNLIKQEKEK